VELPVEVPEVRSGVRYSRMLSDNSYNMEFADTLPHYTFLADKQSAAQKAEYSAPRHMIRR
jgi:hypothetical protein